jgi:hypothetical protein
MSGYQIHRATIGVQLLYAAPGHSSWILNDPTVCRHVWQLSEVLLFTGYLQGAWSTIMHRLDLSIDNFCIQHQVIQYE